MQSLRAPIKVTDAQNQSFRYRLAKLPGILQVQTPVAARISVARQGRRLPRPARSGCGGRHELLVTAPRHLRSSDRGHPWHGAAAVLTGETRRAWAPVTVLTEPAGATVLVDGAARGATTAKLELDAGTHRIELRQAGFKPG